MLTEIYTTKNAEAYKILENARWGIHPTCPYCANTKVWRHPDEDREMPRWQCGGCKRAFCATVKTFLHKTRVPLRIWFLSFAYLSERERINISEFARDVGLKRRATASRIINTIRQSLVTEVDDARIIKNIAKHYGIDALYIDNVKMECL